MKTFERRVRRGLYKFIPKVFNIIVILGLVLQPVGTPGIWNIAFAENTDPVLLVVEETVPAPEVKPAVKEETVPVPEVKPAVKEETVPADTTLSSEEAAPADTVSDTTTPTPSDTPTESPAPTPSIGDTGATTDIPSISEESTPPTEEGVLPVTTEEIPVTSLESNTETAPVTPPADETVVPADTTTPPVEAVESTVAPVSQEVPAEVAPIASTPETAIATEPVSDTECLMASMNENNEPDWSVSGDRAVTNEPVKLGVRYTFPLDKEVTVMFTCLPKDLSKRAPLSIERIKASDIGLPDGVSAASPFAYDITTDGMENGSFKYNLVLPKSEVTGAGVKYIEQSADEVVASDVTENELKAVDEDKMREESDSVIVNGLDHFTIFIATYADFSFVTSETTYLPSDTVYVKAESLSTGAYYRVDIIDPAGSTRTNIVTCQNGATTLGGSHVLSASATISTDWQAEITQYADNGNCTARSSIQDTATAAFGVVAYNASSANPTLSQACGLDIALVIDNSNSIDSTELGQMKTALKGFVNALAGTPTQFSVTRFGTSASVSQNFTANTTLVNSAIDAVPLGGGGTDWQEGISTARGTFDPGLKPNLMIFASDGNPTYPGNGYDTTPANVNAAISEANAAKALNIRMLALGIGEVILDSSDSLRLENLKAISGHIVNDADIEDSDVITTSFAEMATKLRYFAEATCGGTVTVTKKIDADGDLQTTGDQTVASGWTFNVGGQAGQVTDANGQTGAVTLSAGSGYSVTETVQAGYTLASAVCTGAANNGSKSGDAVTGITINNTNIVSCTFINTPDKGSIELKKTWVGTAGNTTLQIGTSAGGTQVDTQAANGGDATTGVNSVNTGTYYVSETSVGSNYDTSLSCTDNGQAVTPGGSNALAVAKGHAVVCTFTNTLNKGSITITKDADPNDAQDFSFTGDLGPFSLDDDADGTLPNTQTFNNVTAGTYNISESSVSGWTLTDIACVDPTNNSSGNLPTAPTTTINLAAGETVTCTITNTRNTGTITVDKVTNPTGDTTNFNFNLLSTDTGVNQNFTLKDQDNPFSSSFATGVYTIEENSLPTGWTLSNLTCNQSASIDLNAKKATFDLDNNENITCTFTNTRNTGTITVDKITDPSGNSQEFTFHVVQIDNNSWNGATQHFNPVPGGFSQIVNIADLTTPPVITVPTGDYDLYEDVPGGWTQGGYTCSYTTGARSGGGIMNYNFDIRTGENATCEFTNTRDTGYLYFTKTVNPHHESGGPVWNFSIGGTDLDAGGWDLSDGAWGGMQLPTGTYSVTEIPHPGINPGDIYDTSYRCIDVDAPGAQFPIGTYTIFGTETTVSNLTLQKDHTLWCEFINSQLSDVHGYKWNDLNGNGQRDAGEPGLPGWTVFIDANGNSAWDAGETKTTTSTDPVHFGWYWFEDLLPGQYKICEVPQAGWNQTYPTPQCHTITLPNDNACGFGQSVNAVTGSECDFGNHFTPPVLQVSKANDSGSPETPGNDVLYTITVTAPENNTTDITDLHVTDLPPAGFKYHLGSWKVKLNGVLQGTVPEPAYHSPGVWDLSSLGALKGDTVELQYTTDIDTVQDAGNYEDLAWAKGKSIVNTDVYANCVGSCQDEGTTPFTGTDVEVVLPAAPVAVALANIVERHVDTKTIHKTKRVLGAATVLPYTGTNINTVLFALMLLLGGLILLLLSKRSTWLLIRSLSKSMTKVFLFAVIGSVLLTSQSASAASGDLNVQIETPKAQVSDSNFKIGFVVLDISNGTPAVTCEVNDGGGFVPFPAAHIEYVAQSGGNSGNCVVDDTVMPIDGTYAFRVTADSVPSAEVPVKLVSGTPSTPLNYSRTSCTVSFTTANDGLTDTVELYRSTSSTFTADTSTFVDDVAILPNTPGTITDTNGDCGGSYFYAIRAVSASGLGSGFVGDEHVVIDNEHKTRTKTTTKHIAGPVTVLGAIPVSGGGAAAGTVEGAATGGEETVQPGAGQEEEGSVLGETTEGEATVTGGIGSWIMGHPWWSAFLLLLLLALGYYGYDMYREKKSDNEPLQ